MSIEDNKEMDESLQGTATVIKTGKPSNGKMLFLESYGCAMNFADSEVVASIMTEEGYGTTSDEHEADIILINTCSIRENAEERIRKRLTNFKNRKKRQPGLIVGVLGCMAERLKQAFLEEEQLVDIVAVSYTHLTLPTTPYV